MDIDEGNIPIAKRTNVHLDAEEREYWMAECKKFWQHMAETGKLRKAMERPRKPKEAQSQ